MKPVETQEVKPVETVESPLSETNTNDSGDYSTNCLCSVKKSTSPKNSKDVIQTIWNPEASDFLKMVNNLVKTKYFHIFNELIQSSILVSKFSGLSIRPHKVNPLIQNYMGECMDIVSTFGSSYETVEKDWLKILFDCIRINNPKLFILLKIKRTHGECKPDFSIDVMT